MGKHPNGLILFIRNPEWGKVKTRLARSLGNDQALRIYLELLRHSREVALALSAKRYLFYSHFIEEEDEWPGTAFEKRLQHGKDLGERMQEAFREVLQTQEKAVLVGSDLPLLRVHHLEEAFARLERADHVLGPASDGGYYLLGMKKMLPALFTGIPWSTDRVAAITLEKIRKSGRTCALLPELPDVDYAEDWEQYGWPL